ncbi:MAG: DUF1569 domain-containing protein [Williamsia sp.]|nr:DUF1569 domain-containing protein [Williamsia sp.]
MKNILDKQDASQLMSRIDKLQADSRPLWGKMDVFQMVEHCQKPLDVYFGTIQLKRGLIGWLFGGMAKRKFLSDAPFPRNLPTVKEFRITLRGDLQKESNKLKEMIQQFSRTARATEVRTHPFFGKLTGIEWAALLYKHTDHHLQQFGV